MGCDMTAPTPEENRRIQEATLKYEREHAERVAVYRRQIEKLLDEGLCAQINEIVAIIEDKNKPSREEIREAAVDVLLSKKYAMPDLNWRIGKRE